MNNQNINRSDQISKYSWLPSRLRKRLEKENSQMVNNVQRQFFEYSFGELNLSRIAPISEQDLEKAIREKLAELENRVADLATPDHAADKKLVDLRSYISKRWGLEPNKQLNLKKDKAGNILLGKARLSEDEWTRRVNRFLSGDFGVERSSGSDK